MALCYGAQRMPSTATTTTYFTSTEQTTGLGAGYRVANRMSMPASACPQWLPAEDSGLSKCRQPACSRLLRQMHLILLTYVLVNVANGNGSWSKGASLDELEGTATSVPGRGEHGKP